MESTGVYWRPLWDVLEDQRIPAVAGESGTGQGARGQQNCLSIPSGMLAD